MTSIPAPDTSDTKRTRTNRNKIAVVAALTAATLGVAGLAALAIPAGAGTAPSLPEISAEELVSSALSARPPAMSGTVRVQNALGLPAVPGLPSQLANGSSDIRVWFDGQGRSRVALPGSHGGEQTVVYDGNTLWRWDSVSRTVTKISGPMSADSDPRHAEAFDPASAARMLLAMVRPTSTIAIDGTAMVAERPAYELVLAPAPTERTLLREVRLAIDSQTRIPLRLEVLANGTNDPVLAIGFEQLSVGTQDASLFQFSPPNGATVTEPDVTKPDRHDALDGLRPTTVGDGWDTVIVTKLPDGVLSGQAWNGPDGAPDTGHQPGHGRPDSGQPGRSGLNPAELLEQFGTPVDGTWGHGWLISTAVVSAIITDDGRVAAGAVPQQVLDEALSR